MSVNIGRRELIAALGGAATWPLAARSQQGERMRRVGVVMGDSQTGPFSRAALTEFPQELQRLGWNNGQNIHIDYRYAGSDPSLIRALVAELVALGPDLIVSNTNIVTTVVQSEVHAIPIVFVGASDPIGSGFVTDLARPTGNLTGFANFEPSMGGKWLQMLREIAPQIQRVGFIFHPEPPNIGYLKSAEAAALSLKIELIGLGVHSGEEIERAVAAFAATPHGGLVVAPNAVTFTNSDLIVALAAQYRLPAIYPYASHAKAGGLISYGNDPAEQFRQAAGYVDRILRGAKLSDLPVQYPTKFQLLVNLKAAQGLGVDVPMHIQQLADEVIE